MKLTIDQHTKPPLGIRAKKPPFGHLVKEIRHLNRTQKVPGKAPPFGLIGLRLRAYF